MWLGDKRIGVGRVIEFAQGGWLVGCLLAGGGRMRELESRGVFFFEC